MSHYLELATQRLESLKGQRQHSIDALSAGDLEAWEAREYSANVDFYNTEVLKAQALVEINQKKDRH